MSTLTVLLPRRALWRLWLTWRFRLFQRHRHRRLALEQVAGIPLIVLPDVFNPALFFSSEALIRVLDDGAIHPGMTVLDVGTGSGVAAIAAARRGARVVAVDISAEAARCARINALLNRVETQVDVRRGDLFEAVTGERFDLILFNPPYYPGAPGEHWEYAWRSEGILDRFAIGLPAALTSGGRALLVLSSEMAGFEETLAAHPLDSRIIRQRDMPGERLSVLEWRPMSKANSP